MDSPLCNDSQERGGGLETDRAAVVALNLLAVEADSMPLLIKALTQLLAEMDGYASHAEMLKHSHTFCHDNVKM